MVVFYLAFLTGYPALSYQRVYFRNTANEDSRRKSIVGRRAGGDTTSEAIEYIAWLVDLIRI